MCLASIERLASIEQGDFGLKFSKDASSTHKKTGDKRISAFLCLQQKYHLSTSLLSLRPLFFDSEGCSTR